MLATSTQRINLTHTSFCSSDIKLQIHTSWVRQELPSLFYHSVIMSSFVPEKEHLRHALLFLFNQKKKAAESQRLLVETYGEHAPSIRTCETWFRQFKSGDFNVKALWETTKMRRRAIAGVIGWLHNSYSTAISRSVTCITTNNQQTFTSNGED